MKSPPIILIINHFSGSNSERKRSGDACLDERIAKRSKIDGDERCYDLIVKGLDYQATDEDDAGKTEFTEKARILGPNSARQCSTSVEKIKTQHTQFETLKFTHSQ